MHLIDQPSVKRRKLNLNGTYSVHGIRHQTISTPSKTLELLSDAVMLELMTLMDRRDREALGWKRFLKVAECIPVNHRDDEDLYAKITIN